MARAPGIKVRSRDAERARRLLKQQGALDTNLRVKHGNGVVFPLAKPSVELGDIPYRAVEEDFEERRHGDAFQRLLAKLGCRLSSFDVIGDIAILEIPEGFEDHGEEIGEALIEARKSIKVVLKKSSAVEGEERLRRFGHLAGERRTETVHREHGCLFKLDVSKVFFSPRLSYERQRIMEQVREGEKVLDMFAGVGPYSIVIARHRPARIAGYDINPHAIEYFKVNIRLNKVAERVEAVLGDSTRLAERQGFDRAIMNLPRKGREHFASALEVIKKGGGMIHYYGSSSRENPFEEELHLLESCALEAGRRIRVKGRRIVRSYSPSEVHIAVDLEVIA